MEHNTCKFELKIGNSEAFLLNHYSFFIATMEKDVDQFKERTDYETLKTIVAEAKQKVAGIKEEVEKEIDKDNLLPKLFNVGMRITSARKNVRMLTGKMRWAEVKIGED